MNMDQLVELCCQPVHHQRIQQSHFLYYMARSFLEHVSPHEQQQLDQCNLVTNRMAFEMKLICQIV